MERRFTAVQLAAMVLRLVGNTEQEAWALARGLNGAQRLVFARKAVKLFDIPEAEVDLTLA